MTDMLWRIDVVTITEYGLIDTPVFEGYATTKALANEVADVYRKFKDDMLRVTVTYEGDEDE